MTFSDRIWKQKESEDVTLISINYCNCYVVLLTHT